MLGRPNYYIFEFPCQYEGCSNSAVGDDTHCTKCDEILCRSHYDSTRHACRYEHLKKDYRSPVPPIDDPCLADIDEVKVTNLLRSLRPGRTPSFHIPRNSWDDEMAHEKTGLSNQHITVRFDDGEEWLLRFPQFSRAPTPRPIIEQVLGSEVTTYQVLYEHGYPVAKVHGWGIGDLSKTNDYQSYWIAYDRVPGQDCDGMDMGISEGHVDESEMRNLIERYAHISVKMSSLTFDKMGSLTKSPDGKVTVGPLIPFGKMNDPAAPYFEGPFDSMRDGYNWRIGLILEAIKAGQIYRDAPLLAYLIMLELRSLINDCEEMSRKPSAFYIQHPDSGGRNIMTSKGEISAVVDWEASSTSCKTSAFGAPLWMVSTHEYLRGNNALTKEEQILREVYNEIGRPDLAECVVGARKYQRVEDILGCQRFLLSDFMGWDEIMGMLNGLTKAFKGDDVKDLPRSPKSWMRSAMIRYANDPHLERVVQLDRRLGKTRRPAPNGLAKLVPWRMRNPSNSVKQIYYRVLWHMWSRMRW